MKVIFMGTPDFAVPTLKKLHEKGHDILLVVTQPDKPSGRGKKLKKSAVKEAAEELGLKVFQPDRIKKAENAEILKKLQSDAIVVVAYGQLLSKEILNIPRLGCINVHASLLPELRGAAPLNWSIINGCVRTGVTTMMMDVGLDTGDMLLKKEVEIDRYMNVGQLHDLLMETGADLLTETLEKIEDGTAVRTKQDDRLSSYAPMLDKQTQTIRWQNKASNIHNLIRGLSPWPAAFFHLDEKMVKVYSSDFSEEATNHEPGFVLKADSDGIVVAAGQGTVILKEIQMPGKTRMTVEAFLRGNSFPISVTLK